MKKAFYFILLFAIVFACKKSVKPDINPSGSSGKPIINPEGGTNFTVTTASATMITSLSATSGGSVVSSGAGPNSVSEKGICYSTSPNPTIANTKIPAGPGPGNFISPMTGLAGNTTYYVRAYAMKNSSIAYGNQVTFATLQTPEPMTDADGNVYNTIKIGTQVWMAGNMRTTTYSNGTPIPNVTDSTVWSSLSTGAYCNFSNDPVIADTYGKLYNWFTLTDPNGIAPLGWHVPTHNEWQTLANYFGGIEVAGGHLKEIGFTHWIAPNVGADNSSGYTGLPSGARYYIYSSQKSVYSGLGYHSPMWTSTSASDTTAWYGYLDWQSTATYQQGFVVGVGYYDKRSGYSLRLVKD